MERREKESDVNDEVERRSKRNQWGLLINLIDVGGQINH
jgi:hypothetical protein